MTEECDKKISETEKAYSDFISTVSHELRTPLTSIRGFADTLLTSYDRLTPEQREKFLLIIKNQSNRLINLVENLLTVSRITSGKDLIVLKTVDVSSYIDSSIQMIKNQYKTHKFVFNCEKNPPKILVDTDKFQQIMLNLLDNAAKYSNENSSVIVTVSHSENENTLTVTVKDEGIGIDKDDLKKIFDKFSRLDSPLTRKVQGNGLGLYITKNLVEKMNGKINVNCPGKGCEFSIVFPVAAEEDACKNKLKENK